VKKLVLAVAVGLVAGVVALAAAMPGMTTCLTIEHAGLERLPDGTLVDPSLSADERGAVRELREQGAHWVRAFIGGVAAEPIVAFLGEGGGHAPWLRSHPVGSTHFVATRACVVIGPQGRTVGIIAHELMHADLHARAGAWHRHMTVPTWFDEGLGMQLDHRPRYSLAPGAAGSTDGVRALESPSLFFAGNDAELTCHYAYAKAEVGRWLVRIGGPAELAERLQRIRQGEPFESVWRD